MLIKSFIGISSGQILFFVFLVLTIPRIFGTRVLSSKSVLSSFFIGISLFTVCAVLSIAGVFGGDNYVYARTFLNLDKLFLLSGFLIMIGIIGQGKFFLNQFQKGIVSFVFFFALIWGFFYSLLSSDRLAQLVKKGDLIENLQFFLLAVSFYYCIRLVKRFVKSKKTKRHALVFIFIAIGIFVIAGEEISWGQKIFSYDVAEFMIGNSSQNEMTIHNTKSAVMFMPLISILVGLYGSFANLFIKNRLYAPGKILLPYFLTPALYNLIAFFNIPNFGIWSEPAELILLAGITLHLMMVNRVTNKN